MNLARPAAIDAHVGKSKHIGQTNKSVAQPVVFKKLRWEARCSSPDLCPQLLCILREPRTFISLQCGIAGCRIGCDSLHPLGSNWGICSSIVNLCSPSREIDLLDSVAFS